MTGYKVGMAEEAVIADLTAKLAECEKDRDAWENACAHWEKEAIESQAREAKLREVLKHIEVQTHVGHIQDSANVAMLQPHEDAALKEYRKKVLLEAADWFDKDAGVYGMDSMWSLSGEKLRRMAEE